LPSKAENDEPKEKFRQLEGEPLEPNEIAELLRFSALRKHRPPLTLHNLWQMAITAVSISVAIDTKLLLQFLDAFFAFNAELLC